MKFPLLRRPKSQRLRTEHPRPQTQDQKKKKSRRHIPRPLLSPDTRTLAKIHRCNFEPLPSKLPRQPADMTASKAIPFRSVKPPPTASKIVPGVHPLSASPGKAAPACIRENPIRVHISHRATPARRFLDTPNCAMRGPFPKPDSNPI